jgi:catechol 2,3-dioxygenase-like lactoylglutathione lyase family enzyme
MGTTVGKNAAVAVGETRAKGPTLVRAERLRAHTGAGKLDDAPVAPRLALRNVDHLALNTTDMRKTIAFYCGVLEMRLAMAFRTSESLEKSRLAGAPPFPYIRHYMFEMGDGGMLAFFEYPPDTPRGNRDTDGTMQHVAFYADRASLHRLVKRLDEHGVRHTPPLYVGWRLYSVYFFDPNGIRLEVTADLEHDDCPRAESLLQSEEDIRAELRTLYPDGEELERVMEYVVALDRPVAGAQKH